MDVNPKFPPPHYRKTCANGTIFLDPQIAIPMPQKDLAIFPTPENSTIVIAHFVRFFRPLIKPILYGRPSPLAVASRPVGIRGCGGPYSVAAVGAGPLSDPPLPPVEYVGAALQFAVRAGY